MTIAAAESTRHRTTGRGAPGRRTFVKSPRSPNHRADLLREAAVYSLVRDRCPATAGRLPEGVRWNAEADELEMAAVPAEDLASHVTAAGVLEPAVAAAVGRAVGEFHAESGDPGDDAPQSIWLRGGIGVDRPGLDQLHRSSAGGIKLLEALQRSEALQARLAGLTPPARDGMVHGDLRWDNLLIAQERSPRVWMVDWEMGGAGERAWDAGCVAAAAVSTWLSSMPQIPGLPPDRLMTEAAIPIGALRPGLDAFWSAYRAAVPDARGDAWAERCAQLVAVRLVHLAFEWADLDTGLRPSAIAHLQVASNILGDPARAGSDLLRIP